MAAPETIKYTMSWRDAKGFVSRTVIHITGDSSVGTFPADVRAVAEGVQAAIGGLTNCAFAGDSGIPLLTPPTLAYGDNLEYPAEWMKAVMTFTTDFGDISRFRIPAPEIDNFDTDGVTVLNDGTQAQVVGYVAAMKTQINSAFVSTRSGQPYTHFVGGILRLGKQPRRFNEFIKSSHLVAGEGE